MKHADSNTLLERNPVVARMIQYWEVVAKMAGARALIKGTTRIC